jgi:hypothetical protein
LNWKQAIINLIGYAGMIIVGVVTQFATENPVATFTVTFIMGLAIRRLSQWLASKKTTKKPQNNSSRINRYIRDRRRKAPKPNNQKRESKSTNKFGDFEPTNYKVKYMGGDEPTPKGKKMTLIMEREGIAVPELRLKIGYDRIKEVELVALKDLKSSQLLSIESVYAIVVIGVMSLAFDRLRGRKRLLKLTSLDEDGKLRNHIFSLKEMSEVQSTISNIISSKRYVHAERMEEAARTSTRQDPTPVKTLQIPQTESPSITNLNDQPFDKSSEHNLSSPRALPPEKTTPKKFTTAVLMTAFKNMKMQREQELITEESYSRYVQGLNFQDDTGNTWIIAKGSGLWYTNKGQSWNPGNPPESLFKIS